MFTLQLLVQDHYEQDCNRRTAPVMESTVPLPRQGSVHWSSGGTTDKASFALVLLASAVCAGAAPVVFTLIVHVAWKVRVESERVLPR